MTSSTRTLRMAALFVVVATASAALARAGEPPKGVSLAIGLNAVSDQHYAGGWAGACRGCENDARDVSRIAAACGFTSTILLTAAATRDAVLGAIRASATDLVAGDIFLLSYSGHGGSIDDKNGDETDDHLDETWCLYDGELVDDELAEALSRFSAGVRILVVSDSCHSGTVVKHSLEAMAAGPSQPKAQSVKSSDLAAYLSGDAVRIAAIPYLPFKAIPSEVQAATLKRNEGFYAKLAAGLRPETESAGKTKAAVLLLAACRDDQFALDSIGNSLFTSFIKAVWSEGRFQGDYKTFLAEIARRVTTMAPAQEPQLFTSGAHDPVFEAQRPFTINLVGAASGRPSGCKANSMKQRSPQ